MNDVKDVKDIPMAIVYAWLAVSLAFGIAVPVAAFYAFQMAIALIISLLGWW